MLCPPPPGGEGLGAKAPAEAGPPRRPTMPRGRARGIRSEGAGMPREKNVREVGEPAALLSGAGIAVATGYAGLTVPQMTDLRRQLREAGVQYRVVKNTLLRIAAERVGRPQLLSVVEGPTAIAFAGDDVLTPVRVLDAFARTGRTTLAVRGAMGEGASVLQVSVGGCVGVLEARRRQLAGEAV